MGLKSDFHSFPPLALRIAVRGTQALPNAKVKRERKIEVEITAQSHEPEKHPTCATLGLDLTQ